VGQAMRLSGVFFCFRETERAEAILTGCVTSSISFMKKVDHKNIKLTFSPSSKALPQLSPSPGYFFTLDLPWYFFLLHHETIKKKTPLTRSVLTFHK
jgi:hypothetical protein